MKVSNRSRIISNISIVLVIIGAMLLLGSLQLHRLGALFAILLTYWPMAIIGMGISSMFNRERRMLRASIAWIAIGSVLQAGMLGWLPRDLLSWWPLFFILIGSWLLLSPIHGQPGRKIVTANSLRYFGMPGRTRLELRSEYFENARISMHVGILEIDCLNAISGSASMTMELTARLAKITLLVPDHWYIDIPATGLRDSIMDTRVLGNPPKGEAPVLVLNGHAFLSTLRITDCSTDTDDEVPADRE